MNDSAPTSHAPGSEEPGRLVQANCEAQELLDRLRALESRLERLRHNVLGHDFANQEEVCVESYPGIVGSIQATLEAARNVEYNLDAHVAVLVSELT